MCVIPTCESCCGRVTASRRPNDSRIHRKRVFVSTSYICCRVLLLFVCTTPLFPFDVFVCQFVCFALSVFSVTCVLCVFVIICGDVVVVAVPCMRSRMDVD